MRIKVIQNSVGQYNLFNSREKSLSFSLGIVGDDNKVIEVDGVKCVLYYSGEEEDQYEFQEPIQNIERTFEKCWGFANRVYSSVDHKARCLAFAKYYSENYEALNIKYIATETAYIQEKINHLQKELKRQRGLDDISHAVNQILDTKLVTLRKWKKDEIRKQLQTVPNTNLWKAHKEQIEDYDKQIEKLENNKI